MYRIGKMELDNTDEDYRHILIELQNVETKYNILKESKRLKNWEEIDGKDVSLGTKNIFINLDETPLTRKENTRLRKERNRLRSLEENKEKKIFISKGKLKIDNIIHDEFKIENSLFQMWGDATGLMEIKILSWNCNGKFRKLITFLNNYTQYHIMHLSETKHNSYTNFNVLTNFICVSNPGTMLGVTDRGANILFIKKPIYKVLKKRDILNGELFCISVIPYWFLYTLFQLTHDTTEMNRLLSSLTFYPIS